MHTTVVSFLDNALQLHSLQTLQLQESTSIEHLLEVKLDLSFTIMYKSYILWQSCQGLIV